MLTTFCIHENPSSPVIKLLAKIKVNIVSILSSPVAYHICAYLLIILGYFIGSISSAICLAKCFKLPDPRTRGSQNPGASNMTRQAGKAIGALTLACDLLKALLPLYFGQYLDLSVGQTSLLMLTILLGHLYPIYHRLHGGKGVAVYCGFTCFLNPWLAVTFVSIWLIVLWQTKYASLSSLLAIFMTTCMSYWLSPLPCALALLISCVWISLKHHSNIQRLLSGNEKTIS
ncbi:glycerol-3-phosphate 1-O-acyltransferase PlsY [Gammaproteobacteria bacterium]|nr:glycerol-3-phosphate 1-O-acyltransferase PlsY [Gammaproteobacteria bacterium]